MGAGEEAGASPWDRGSRRPTPPRLRGSENTSQIHFSQRLARGWGRRVQELGRCVDGPPRVLGARAWRLRKAKGVQLPLVLDCSEPSQAGQKEAESIPETHAALSALSRLRLRRQRLLAARPGTAAGVTRPFISRQRGNALPRSLVYCNRAEKGCAPLAQPGLAPSPSPTPSCNSVGGSLG